MTTHTALIVDDEPDIRELLEITLIRDVTPLPHNGCRRPKRRRV